MTVMLRQPFSGTYPITLDFGETWGKTYTKDNPHRGIDYGCPLGTPVLAAADGTVLTVGFAQTGYGNYIIIQHKDGSGTVYAHLNTTKAGIYKQVQKGEVIGYSGNTGNSSGAHLHFEYRSNASDYRTAEDPKPFMQSVLDGEPIQSTPAPVKPEFEPVRAGYCVVVCDYANVRCHCDMTRVMGMRKKGDIIAIGDETTIYNGLPYRDYYDAEFKCWLRIAEHDPTTQIIRNHEGM